MTAVESGGGGCVRWETDGRVGRITLKAPERRNALGHDDWVALEDALGELERRNTVLHFAGGEQWFCAGFNVRSIKPVSDGVLAAGSSLRTVNGVLRRLWNYPNPVVASVEGAAIGAGMALAAAADLVIAARSAFFAPPTALRGLVPDVGVAWILEHRLGHQRAAAMVFLGERLDAAQAEAVGLVNSVVDDGQADATGRKLAERLATTPADTARIAKVMLRRAEETELVTSLDCEEAYVSINSMSPAAEDARQRFFAPKKEKGDG